MTVTLMILIGIPAVGKTHLANNLCASRHFIQQFKFLHVNFDKLLPKKDYQELRPLQWKIDRYQLLQEIGKLLDSLLRMEPVIWSGKPFELANDERLVIIIDDNMYYRSMRRSYYQLAQSFNCGFCQVYLSATLDMALQANAQRPQRDQVNESTIRKMFDNIDPPNVGSGWETKTLHVNSFEPLTQYFPNIMELLKNSFEHPERITAHQAHDPGPALHSSVLHVVDVALRKIVGQTIKQYKTGMSDKELKEFTKQLLETKLTVFDDVKKGIIAVTMDTADKVVEEEFLRRLGITFANSFAKISIL